MSDTNQNNSHGFTLIEVLVVVPTLLLVIAGMLAILIVILQHNNSARATLNVSYRTQQALDVMDNDIRYSSRFLVATDLTPVTDDVYGSDNAGQDWSYKDYDATHRVLITRSYSSTTNLLSNSRGAIYKDTVGCVGASKYANPVMQYNAVYFIRNGTLYKRTLVDTTTATCDPQYQQQSCPIDVTYPRDASCKADDEVLLENADTMTIEYYTLPTDSTPIDAFSSVDPDIIDTAQSVLVTLTSSITVAGEPVTSTLILRGNKINL